MPLMAPASALYAGRQQQAPCPLSYFANTIGSPRHYLKVLLPAMVRAMKPFTLNNNEQK